MTRHYGYVACFQGVPQNAFFAVDLEYLEDMMIDQGIRPGMAGWEVKPVYFAEAASLSSWARLAKAFLEKSDDHYARGLVMTFDQLWPEGLGDGQG